MDNSINFFISFLLRNHFNNVYLSKRFNYTCFFSSFRVSQTSMSDHVLSQLSTQLRYLRTLNVDGCAAVTDASECIIITRTRTCTHTHTHANTKHTRVYTRTHTHARTHARTHTHTHARTHTHMHTRTHALTPSEKLRRKKHKARRVRRKKQLTYASRVYNRWIVKVSISIIFGLPHSERCHAARKQNGELSFQRPIKDEEEEEEEG